MVQSGTKRPNGVIVVNWVAFCLCTALGCGGAEEIGPPRLAVMPSAYENEAPPSTATSVKPVPVSSAEPVVSEKTLTTCGDTSEGFDVWLANFRQYAVKQSVSAPTVNAALNYVNYDPRVIELDRSQKSFKLTFEQFYRQRVNKTKLAQGKQMMRANRALLSQIDARFGVAPSVLVAIWGLETDYGANMGSMPVFRSLATLAYDCRRAERFRGELLSALRIAERGDVPPGQMYGAWAGELGQTQFLASSYEKYAIDFDGDGRADLLRSSADALASTANYLKNFGWKPGEAFGPGTSNYSVLESWNKAEVYRKTIAQFASKLGTP